MTPPTSKLAIVALAFAILFAPLGMILGIAAIIYINRRPQHLSGIPLAIAAVVIGLFVSMSVIVFATMAAPQFVSFECRAKTTPAKTALKSLWVAQESYRAEFGVYATSFEQAGFDPTQYAKHYSFRFVEIENGEADPSFVIEAATTDPALNDDTWRIDHNRQLQNLVDGCAP